MAQSDTRLVFQRYYGNLVSREVLLKRMEKYIKDVVGHFSGNSAWDVVNEAIDPNQPDGLRRTLWYDIIDLNILNMLSSCT